jgi:hypothetical protein
MPEKAYLQYIYCEDRPQIKRELSHTIKSRCACVWNMVDIYIYMVASLIILCPLKTYLSFGLWDNFARKHGLSYSSHFFQAGILVPIVLIIQTLVYFFFLFFSFFFFMNNFSIAHASFLQ